MPYASIKRISKMDKDVRSDQREWPEVRKVWGEISGVGHDAGQRTASAYRMRMANPVSGLHTYQIKGVVDMKRLSGLLIVVHSSV